MPINSLKPLSPKAQAVFDHLTEGIEVGGARKIDNAKGLFMAVSIDRLTERHYSIVHAPAELDRRFRGNWTADSGAIGPLIPVELDRTHL